MEVILLMATTLDGMIARDSRQFVDWSGKADKQYFVKITRDAGAMIMGSKTYDTIGRPLPGRLNIVMTRDKSRKSDSDNLIFTDQAPSDILRDLENRGYDKVALIGGAIVNSMFAKANLITDVHLTLVPKIFGKGLSLFTDTLDMELELTEYRELDKGHLLMIYRVV
ncbi:MAG TPA: dihydrofolate reductase [Desulfobacteraceae bacterium]|nr:dihydrofolate reductase [Desulfobacteraceae bacterium]|tara:strand:+ start:145 stop:645 length:501 start_codon:yes stop_codon:yes gene_type:complete